VGFDVPFFSKTGWPSEPWPTNSLLPMYGRVAAWGVGTVVGGAHRLAPFRNVRPSPSAALLSLLRRSSCAPRHHAPAVCSGYADNFWSRSTKPDPSSGSSYLFASAPGPIAKDGGPGYPELRVEMGA
jgi:hypothetical protein